MLVFLGLLILLLLLLVELLLFLLLFLILFVHLFFKLLPFFQESCLYFHCCLTMLLVLLLIVICVDVVSDAMFIFVIVITNIAVNDVLAVIAV